MNTHGIQYFKIIRKTNKNVLTNSFIKCAKSAFWYFSIIRQRNTLRIDKAKSFLINPFE